MKILLVIILLLGQSTFAATSKKKVAKKKVEPTDKVYTVAQTVPEIIIGEREKLSEKNKTSFKRSKDLWYLAVVRSALRYRLPSLTGSELSFSPNFVGLIIGKKNRRPVFFI